MKVGKVAQIRLSPADCMSCVDVAQRVGALMPGMSFAIVVKIALASLLESARQAGAVNRRDGFEYSEVMAQFEESNFSARGRKLQITELVNKQEIAPQPVIPETPERGRRRRRWQELKFMYDADPENHPLPIPGTPEFVEWDALCQEFA